MALLYSQSSQFSYIACLPILTNVDIDIICYSWLAGDTGVLFLHLRIRFSHSHWTVSQDSGVWTDWYFLRAVWWCQSSHPPCYFVAKLFPWERLESSQFMSVTEVSTALFPPQPRSHLPLQCVACCYLWHSACVSLRSWFIGPQHLEDKMYSFDSIFIGNDWVDEDL